jgi:N-carbamoylputrescine amidase
MYFPVSRDLLLKRGGRMRIVRCALIQTKGEEDKEAMIDKHEKFIREAAEKGAKIICLQELFYSIYFPAEQDPKWFDLAEPVPEGPTTKRMQELAKELGVVLIVPIFEV